MILSRLCLIWMLALAGVPASCGCHAASYDNSFLINWSSSQSQATVLTTAEVTFHGTTHSLDCLAENTIGSSLKDAQIDSYLCDAEKRSVIVNLSSGVSLPATIKTRVRQGNSLDKVQWSSWHDVNISYREDEPNGMGCGKRNTGTGSLGDL